MEKRRPRNQTRDWAIGRWKHILSEKLSDRQLSGEHTICPICGGKDRFRFDDKEGRGSYFCNVCGAGDGFDLLQKLEGWSFSQAAKYIDEVVRHEDVPRETFKENTDTAVRRAYLNDIWVKAKSNEVVADYLAVWRGFKTETAMKMAESSSLRGTESLFYPDHRAAYRGVLAMVKDLAGRPVNIHRTWLMDPKPIRKLSPGVAKLEGASIQLLPQWRQFVVGEGLETSIAGWQILTEQGLRDLGCFSAISAGNLAQMKVPDSARRIWICADADESFTGQAAAFELARRMRLQKVEVSVLMPFKMGQDMDDIKAEESGGYQTF
jgi:putative DNA primase/helicase